jgi:hypothetical protein
MKKLIWLGCALILAACRSGNISYKPNSPVTIRTDKVKISANEKYNEIGKLDRIFLGEHFRKEWATPVEVAVLQLDSLEEQLTPVRMGGGQQTKSLRLKSADGKEYVLRSINKDPSKALPPEFVGTFVNTIVQDQVSSSNPYAPLVIADLAEAAGIFHTLPKVVFVEKAPSLGEYNEIFGNTMNLFEERPAGNQEHNSSFGYSKNVVNSEKLFEKLFQDTDHQVDEKPFLKARLFDMWVGDWDRHEDQWVWASFKEEGKTIYKPIPRDRDQAFVKLDGVIPQLAARKWAVRKTQNFDYSIRDINGLNLSGNPLDRIFTTELTWLQWQETIQELQQDLTDAKIDSALLKFPIEIQRISADDISRKLKRRRDDLLKYASKYYQFLSREINIVGSDKNEFFEINRFHNDSTRITVYSVTKKNEVKDTVYQRTFLTRETKEIRLYGLDGIDKFIVTGKVKYGILVRIMGGGEMDEVQDESKVNGWLHKTIIYDNEASVNNLYKEAIYRESLDTIKNNYNRKSYKYNWLAPKVSPGFNPDDGIYLGGGFLFKKHTFGKLPFGHSHSIWGNYAFETSAYNFQYDANFIEAIGKWNMGISAKVNAPNGIYNYYGMGNKTEVLENDWIFYRIRLNQIIVNPSFQRNFNKNHSMNVGVKFHSVRLEETEGRFITKGAAQLDSTIFDRKNFGAIGIGYQYSSLDNLLNTKNGIRWASTAEYTQNLRESTLSFVKLSSSVSGFKTFGKVTLALRVGGSTILNNDFEFYQASTLGGIENLRGYRRTRFAGRSSIYQNTEVRYAFNRLKGYIFRGNYGALAFFDAGRVWIPSEESNSWHNGYGGGVWFQPYNKISFTATYSISRETNIINLRAGFLF